MAKKKTNHTKAKVVSGVGLGVAAAMAAGAYFLYGTKEGSKRRAQIKGWMLKAKGEVLDRLEQLKDVNQKTYHKIVDEVARKYQGLSNVDSGELKKLKDDLKRHWRNIQKQIEGGGGRKTSSQKRKSSAKKRATPKKTTRKTVKKK